VLDYNKWATVGAMNRNDPRSQIPDRARRNWLKSGRSFWDLESGIWDL